MPYVLKKGNHYCFKDADNTINKVPNVKSATMFANEKHAQAMLLKCSKKLKGFEIVDLDTIDCDEKSNTVDKSKQIKEKRKSFNTKERIFIYNRNKGKCAICGEFVPFDEFTVDHIIPLSKGGTNKLNNLQCTCKTCNLVKQDILPKDLMDKLTQIVFYQMQINYKNSYWKEMKKIHKKYIRYRIRKATSIFNKR